MLSAGKRNRNRRLSTPTDVTQAASPSYQGRNRCEGHRGQILPLCRSLAQRTDTGLLHGVRRSWSTMPHVTSPVRGVCAHTLRNPPGRFTSSSTGAFLTGVSTNQPPTVRSRRRSRGSRSRLSARALLRKHKWVHTFTRPLFAPR